MYNDNIPNCVPEYFREKFEREEHEAELRWKLTEHYNANKLKLKKHMKMDYPFCFMEVIMTANTARMQIMIHKPVTMMISVA